MTLRQSLFAASLALAACAGPGGYKVNADVRSLQPGAKDASGLANASGATIDLVCPGAENKELGRTDQSGSLQVEGEGVIPLACKLNVSQPGARAVQYPVADLCREQNTEGCRELTLRAILGSSSSGSAGDSH